MLTNPNRVKKIFLEAAEQPDEAARVAYLDRACGDDAGLRDRVEALLRSHDPAGSFLASPAVAPPQRHELETQRVDSSATQDDENEADDALGFLQPSTRLDSLGSLGHYEILKVLGKGGFGIVFRAFDETLQRIVAIKVLSAHIAATSPARKRFLREARSSAKVRHENIVQVYAVEEQPLPYLVMEFIPGETLQQRLDRTGPLETAEVLQFGRQIAEGLAAAHTAPA
jgi:eukaryotic-like serine/threonine-protein kinase